MSEPQRDPMARLDRSFRQIEWMLFAAFVLALAVLVVKYG